MGGGGGQSRALETRRGNIMQRKKLEDTSCWLEGPSLINLFVNTRFMSSKASLRLKRRRAPAVSHAHVRASVHAHVGQASPPANLGGGKTTRKPPHGCHGGENVPTQSNEAVTSLGYGDRFRFERHL